MLHRTLVCVILFRLALSCDFNAEDSRARCPSFESLSRAKNQQDWEKLNVESDGQQYVTVKKNSFEKTSNVYDLQVKGLASRFERGTFAELKKLFELHLDDNRLGRIPARSFENPNMQALYLYNCEITDIQPKALENIPKLKYVWATGNSIQTIRKDVFNNNNELRVISLRNNKINHVELEAFTRIPNLERLSLEENELTFFEPNLIIGHNPSLYYLYINRNQLSEISREMFSSLPNLGILLININQIQHIGEKAFADLKNLLLLDLSHNQIEELRPDILPPFHSKIVKLFAHDNRLTYISSGFLVRLPNLQQISSTGNPWQCPCQDHFRTWLFEANVTRICDREVKNGERPSCVLHPRDFRECVYDLENSREVVTYYMEKIKEYPDLPPVCETDGKDVPTLGAK